LKTNLLKFSKYRKTDFLSIKTLKILAKWIENNVLWLLYYFFLAVLKFKNSTKSENAIAKYKYPFGIAPTDFPKNSVCDR
jgi:hypothetical protein